MNWIVWVIVAFVFIILEISTPSMLFFTCLAVGCFVAAIFSFFGVSHIAGYIVFAIVSIVSLFTIRPLFKKTMKESESIKTNVDALIGKSALVTEKISLQKDGFVKVGGEIWLAQSDFDIEEGQYVKIESISGTKLKVVK
jgi:membrane protein implicated in regulation of membrane protease activity